jgi:hypothetical protein
MFHISTCPHCRKHQLALTVVSAITISRTSLNLYFHCPNCEQPSCGKANYYGNESTSALLKTNRSCDSLKIDVLRIWPEQATPEIPECLPEVVVRSLLQAETNFHEPGHEEAAAIMYRKALEVGLKTLAPDLTGALYQRINSMADSGRLTRDLADWAKEIKNLGNEGAHELEAIDRTELEQMRGLVSKVLQYLFTLPAQVKALRSQVKEIK